MICKLIGGLLYLSALITMIYVKIEIINAVVPDLLTTYVAAMIVLFVGFIFIAVSDDI